MEFWVYFGRDVYWFCTVSDFLFALFFIEKDYYIFFFLH